MTVFADLGTLIKTSDVLVRNNTYANTSMHCILAFPDGCYWFESNGFRNWTIQGNVLDNCGGGSGGAGTPPSDIFVAACTPHWVDGQPAANGQGDPITTGQPFQDGAVTGNTFIQRGEAHAAVELYGFDGLVVKGNDIISPVSDFGSGPGALQARHLLHLHTSQCSGLCDSLDGFAVAEKEATVHGWIVDTTLKAPTVSSSLVVKIDGKAVATDVANTSRPDLVPVVCPTPKHGFQTTLGPSITDALHSGNHTLAVFARRPDGTLKELSGSPVCVNKFRRSCGFPDDCMCGAPLPPRLKISNSIMCHADEDNTCDGATCTFTAAGCTP